MKKLLIASVAVLAFTLSVVSCKKSVTGSQEISSVISTEEKALVKAAGFNSNWAEKLADGTFLIEDDISLTKAQLEELSGKPGAFNLIVGNEEHYRTTNVVSTGGGVRTITVSLGSGFPTYYSTGLDQALAQYNALNLTIKFLRVSSGGEISITGKNLGKAVGGGCILGQAAGFPTASGNPSPGFTLSTTKCATQYLNTASKVQEVIAHEMGHCIGFRHTDYMNRASCGSNSNEGDAGIGAIYIPGTPSTYTAGAYDSWMLACTNGSPALSTDDVTALNYVY